MSTTRIVQPLPVPAGVKALDVVPALERALDGQGPALLPLPAGDGESTGRALGANEPLAGYEDDPEDPTAVVIATSGSTGTPKGVLLPASALRASADATHRHLGGPGTWLLAMPAQHIAGVQVLIRALIAGTRPHAVETSGGFRPDQFADAAERALASPGPHYTALVPTQLNRLLNEEQGLRALRKFDAVLLGGAATSPALLRQARAASVRVITTYGMSETSGGCVYDGVALPGARVQVRNGPDDPGAAGPIRISGPMVARGYRRVPPAGAPTGAFDDSWFHTGDLGRWREGRLEILGRADDLIVTGGVNIAPAPIERALAEQGGVREACVVGIDDPEWGQTVVAAVVPTDPSAAPAAPAVDALRDSVRERLGAAATPKQITFLPELPLRGPGKPDRKALQARFGAAR